MSQFGSRGSVAGGVGGGRASTIISPVEAGGVPGVSRTRRRCRRGGAWGERRGRKAATWWGSRRPDASPAVKAVPQLPHLGSSSEQRRCAAVYRSRPSLRRVGLKARRAAGAPRRSARAERDRCWHGVAETSGRSWGNRGVPAVGRSGEAVAPRWRTCRGKGHEMTAAKWGKWGTEHGEHGARASGLAADGRRETGAITLWHGGLAEVAAPVVGTAADPGGQAPKGPDVGGCAAGVPGVSPFRSWDRRGCLVRWVVDGAAWRWPGGRRGRGGAGARGLGRRRMRSGAGRDAGGRCAAGSVHGRRTRSVWRCRVARWQGREAER
jgi:hypothetical protein